MEAKRRLTSRQTEAALRLQTFGGLALTRNGETVRAQKRSLLVLAAIAAARNGGITRESLINILWTESGPDSGRAALRQALFTLRRELENDNIVVGNTTLSFDPQEITSDIEEFNAAVDSKDWSTAVQLYSGDFLDGAGTRGTPGFDQWVDSIRAQTKDRYRAALEQLGRDAASEGKLDDALSVWRRLVDTDPLSSRATAGLMTALLQSGDRNAALQQYEKHREALASELQAAPEASVRALAERIRSDHDDPLTSTAAINPGQSEPPNPKTHSSSSRILFPLVSAIVILIAVTGGLLWRSHHKTISAPRIVVLPFTNRTGASDLDAFGSMTAAWIIDALSDTPFATVVDGSQIAQAQRTSVTDNRYDFGSNLPRAEYALVGDYFKKGNDIEVYGRFIVPRTGEVIATVHPVLARIDSADEAATQIGQTLLGAVAERLDDRISSVIDSHRTPPKFAAYKEYASGLELFYKRQFALAAERFIAAYQADTTFAAALLWATISYDNTPQRRLAMSTLSKLDSRRNTLSKLDRYGYESLRYNFAGDLDNAINHARAAALIAPNSEWAWLAAFWTCVSNRPLECIGMLKQMDPSRGWLAKWPLYYRVYAMNQHALKDYKGEMETLAKGYALYPDLSWFRVYQIRSLGAAGRFAEMYRALDQDFASGAPIMPPQIPELIRDMVIHHENRVADSLYVIERHWYDSHPESVDIPNYVLGISDFRLGRYAEARRRFQREARSDQFSWGLLGTCAGKLGDTAVARAMSDSLSRLDDINNRGVPSYWRARIAASLNQKDSAVAFLDRAFTLGIARAELGHSTEWEFPELSGYEPFIRLLRL